MRTSWKRLGNPSPGAENPTFVWTAARAKGRLNLTGRDLVGEARGELWAARSPPRASPPPPARPQTRREGWGALARCAPRLTAAPRRPATGLRPVGGCAGLPFCWPAVCSGPAVSLAFAARCHSLTQGRGEGCRSGRDSGRQLCPRPHTLETAPLPNSLFVGGGGGWGKRCPVGATRVRPAPRARRAHLLSRRGLVTKCAGHPVPPTPSVFTFSYTGGGEQSAGRSGTHGPQLGFAELWSGGSERALPPSALPTHGCRGRGPAAVFGHSPPRGGRRFLWARVSALPPSLV